MPLTTLAQINGAGYYRVQNKASQRFLLLVDNRGSINWSNTSVDLGAFQTIGTFDENVCWNPATICYIEGTSKANFYNISGQGLDLYKITDTYMKFTKQNDGSYIISGEATKAGATVADVKLMRETVGPDMGVKAAGGIHNRAEAEAMIAAGATRIGASSGIAIVTE